MAIAVAAFGLLITSLSAWGITNPVGLINLVRGATGKPFMYLAVGSRILLAMLLWFAASSARHPMAFKVLAIIALIAAVGILLVGKERILKLVEWVAHKPASLQRSWIFLGVGFGLFLLWEVWPQVGAMA